MLFLSQDGESEVKYRICDEIMGKLFPRSIYLDIIGLNNAIMIYHT